MDLDQRASAHLRILIVEDIESDAELCRIELERGGLRFTLHRVDTRQQYEEALADEQPDLILCDFSMPGAFDGMTALELARRRSPDTPFIFLSSFLGEERVVEAMRRGAADCVLKNHMVRLVPAVRRALHESARRRAEAQKHEPAPVEDAQLRDAFTKREFELYYQPRVSLETGEVCGLEALIRWRNPELGLLLADEFVPILEETGLIVEVGRWALERAALDAEDWRAGGAKVPSIGVNVSAVQLREDDFVDSVTHAIAAGDHSSIDLELTESVVMADIEKNARKLEALRASGIKIAIDDFGTGYSSLSYLAHLPADALKINRAFVASMATSRVHTAIVTTIISLARCLQLRAVAEGVETEQEADRLYEMHCDEGQGYLYSHPVPAREVGTMLDRLWTTRRTHAH